jgi:hypothetical protein
MCTLSSVKLFQAFKIGGGGGGNTDTEAESFSLCIYCADNDSDRK